LVLKGLKVIPKPLQASNRYKSDPSNEALYTLVSQEVAKIFEVKVGNSDQFEPDAPGAG